MKQPPSVSRILSKVSEIFDTLDLIKRRIERDNSLKLSVTFYHDKDLNLVGVKWADQYYPKEDSDRWEGAEYSYTYELDSRGISFASYERRGKGDWWNPEDTYHQGGNCNLSLLAVPNKYKPEKTMYLFHQEKIREHFSAIPAWATAVVL